MFIAIDGTDGSGKTVQTKKLVERLEREGRRVEMLDFPRYGNPSAFYVEKYLAGEYGTADEVGPYRASVFFAVDRYDDAARIRGLFNDGVILISNRYTSANKGHQMGKIKDPDEQKKFISWLNEFEYGLLGIPKPDLTIFLHVPAEIGHKLVADRDGNKKDIHQQDLNHLKAAEAAFLALPDVDTEENWRVVTCTEHGALMPINAIHERVWSLVIPYLNR